MMRPSPVSVARGPQSRVEAVDGDSVAAASRGRSRAPSRRPVVGDHHVGGLQVAMGDAALVRGADRVGQRDGDPQQVGRAACPAAGCTSASVLPSTSSIVRNRTPSCLLDGVDRDDVGMVQRGDGARLALEAVAALGIGARARGQDLQRDLASELGVLGQDRPRPCRRRRGGGRCGSARGPPGSSERQVYFSFSGRLDLVRPYRYDRLLPGRSTGERHVAGSSVRCTEWLNGAAPGDPASEAARVPPDA